MMHLFNPEEVLRYSRHFSLPEVGAEGQAKLKEASVIVIGAGGLGCPVLMYLALAGVGRIGVVDSDTVDASNLQRQFLYRASESGKAKADLAAVKLRELNPHILVTPHSVKLTSQNALEILKSYDVVIDGTDNFATRYLVNDACVLLQKPNIYGSIFRFEGQVSLFQAKEGPCYRCLTPTPPPPDVIPNCAEAGVLGVLPGIVGALQATEAIKWILGLGRGLMARLLHFDALTLQFQEFSIKKNPDCIACGSKAQLKTLQDLSYETCSPLPMDQNFEITAEQLKQSLNSGERLFILDVREPHEYSAHNLGGTLIPLRELGSRLSELNKDQAIVVHCEKGGRSARAVSILRNAGFRNVKNLIGGLEAWESLTK